MKYRSSGRMAVLASTLLASASTVALAGEVTSDRLMNADKEPQNWLMVNKDYSSHRYSELDQINKDNVKNLHVAFTVALGGAVGVAPMTLGGHQSTPLVNDGWMYVVDGFGAVYKIDVRDPQKAKIAWIMDPGIHEGRCVDTPRTAALPSTRTSSFPSPATARCCGPTRTPANW